MTDKLKISKLKIENILGIKQLDFSPSAGFNEISGPNGSGKTSVLEAIKAATGSGHDATLLRTGAEKGELVLVLDDDITEIRKRVSAEKTDAEVRRDGKKISGPASAIRALTDMLSVNPVDFLRAPKKDRVKVLLESMPIEADSAKLSEIAGYKIDIPEGTHALQAIDAVYTQIFDARTGTNGAIKEKKGTISQLEQALPDATGEIDGNEDELSAKLEAARSAKDAELLRIQTKLGSIRIDSQAVIDKIKADAQAAVDKLRADEQTAIDAERARLAEIESKANGQRDRTTEKFTLISQPINESLAAIRANRDVSSKREQSIKIIEKMKDDNDVLEETAAEQTGALTRLESYKSELLSSLPIPGLEVRAGEIYRYDVPLDRLNTAQQVQIAVEVAKLRAGSLGVVVVDGIELLDTATYKAFKAEVEQSGLQLFVAKVSDQPFSINGVAAEYAVDSNITSNNQ